MSESARAEALRLCAQARVYPSGDAFDSIVRLIALARQRPGWVSVKDRLPENSAHVLVWLKSGEVGIGGFSRNVVAQHDCWWYTGVTGMEPMNGVTHWMPLPPKPEDADVER